MPHSAEAKRQLDELRARIAEIDQSILERLEARARASKEIYQRLEGEPAAPDVSEGEWLRSLQNLASGDLPEPCLRAIFHQVRAAARSIEQPVRVSFLGPEGSFCHQMAKSYFGATTPFTESMTVPDALEEVVRGRAVFAAFPFESSVEGLVQTSITALAQTELVVVAERTLSATYDVMSRTGNLADIEKVYATASAHAACEQFLNRELPKASVLDVRSPLIAAQLAHEDHGGAAIVPEGCGREAGLEVVRANVGDSSDLSFRYCVASARPAPRSGTDTTCLLFSVDDRPGSLFDVLRHFAERGLNLRKLQSRPVQTDTWDYVFYVEVGGHVTDRPVVTALEAVKRSTKYLKVLGSFPIDA